MHSVEQTAKTFTRYGGVMRRKELTQEGIHACTLQRFELEGYIQKIRPGYYEWIADNGPDELALIRRIFPEAIICMNSALHIYTYSDRVPRVWHLAAPQNATRSKYRHSYPKVQPYFRTSESLKLGAVQMQHAGHIINIYDRERTICDCIAHRRRMDQEVFAKAIQAYCIDPARDISRLMRYARKLRIEKPTNDLIGLWQ